MNFELAHFEFIRKHQKQQRGEALRRLKEGHGHAESFKERPRSCIQLVQQFIGRWHSGEMKNMMQLSAEGKDILRFAMRTNRSFTPKQICDLLNIEKQKARNLLHGLLGSGFLVPGGKGKERVYCYQISKKVTSDDLWM